MTRDIVLLLDGGGLAGVFGAGVVTAIEESGFTPRIHSAYAVSAGAHNAAYLLAGQTRLGSSIYWEDLSGRQFVRWNSVLKYLGRYVLSRFRHGAIHEPLLDFTHLETVENTTKRLDVGRIRQHPAQLNVAVFDIDDCVWRFVNGKDDTVRVLRASSSIGPFCDAPVLLNGHRCIDGGTIRTSATIQFVDDHPEFRFFYIMNRPFQLSKRSPSKAADWLNAQALGWRFGARIARAYARHQGGLIPPSEILRRSTVTGIINDFPTSIFVADRKKLLALYAHGLAMGTDACQRLK